MVSLHIAAHFGFDHVRRAEYDHAFASTSMQRANRSRQKRGEKWLVQPSGLNAAIALSDTAFVRSEMKFWGS